MNLSSSIDYTLLQNKFYKQVVVLWFWDFGRSRDQKESGGSIHGTFVVITGTEGYPSVRELARAISTAIT